MTKRNDGRYVKQVYIGKKETDKVDADGNPILVNEYRSVYGRTEKEVIDKAAEIIVKVRKGYNVASASDRFELWCERFIKQKESVGLTSAYIVALKSRIKHLEPLYDIPLSKVTMMEIQDVILNLDLSKRTLGSIRSVASQVFELAIIARVIDFNPAKYVTIPKKAPAKKRSALTKEQQRWVVETPHRAQLAAMIMMYAGLRRGELIPLTWGDIDLANSTIRVNKAVEMVNGLPKLKDTKTEAGDRIVDIPDVLTNYLSSVKQDCFYVVHMQNGNMYSSSAWKRLWESYMADLNVKYGYDGNASKHNPHGLEMKIEPFTAYQLRHTFCSLLYLAGADVLMTKDQMGHSKVETTLGIYAHLDKEHKRKNVKMLNQYLSDTSQTG